MKTEKFLEKVAKQIIADYHNKLIDTVVIFPNRRPKIFLKKYITENSNGSLIIPDILSIEEFIGELSSLSLQDPFLTWFELYNIHKKIEKNEIRDINDFINWAPIMLSDFNEIDMALVDAKNIFNYLSEIKAIETWEPDRALTDFEKRYIEFFRDLFKYYHNLKNTLIKKSLGTKGMVYRDVAENMEHRTSFPWKHFIFAGFNASTASEIKIISKLYKKGNTSVFFDIDEYYYYPEKYKLPYQEAGYFIKRLINKLKINTPQWITDNLIHNKKNIEIIAVPKNITQVKLTANILEKQLSNKTNVSPAETAVVLSDENLLLPLITSLPNVKSKYNITMGYPLEKSSIFNAVNIWLEILLKSEQNKNNNIYIPLLISFFQNPLIKLLNKQTNEIIDKLKATKSLYLDIETINKIIEDGNNVYTDILLDIKHDIPTLYKNLIKYINTVKKEIDEIEKEYENNNFNKRYPLLKQEIASFFAALKKLNLIVERHGNQLNIKILKKIFKSNIKSTTINLQGEPLEGVQLMGMLETRLLDFKRIIILSANEGSLPKLTISDSFIPFDIRNEFSLPLPKDKTAIYAYYFYRLIQRAEDITIMFNSEPGSLGSGEQSRFIYQLEMETAKVNKNINLKRKHIKYTELPELKETIIEFKKDETVMKKLTEILKNGLSASTLNQYIKCPLQFYFSKIAELDQPNEFKTVIESDIFGNIVHEILENIYKPDLNKIINTKRLNDELDKIDSYLNTSINKFFNPSTALNGKNILLLEMIKKYVKNFISYDIKELEKVPRVLIGVEKSISVPLIIEGLPQVTIKGIIDRMDKNPVTGEIRIIDYKTGMVKEKEVSFSSWEDLKNDNKYSKAFQTILYGWAYKKQEKFTNNISIGLISLRALSSGFITPKISKNTITSFDEFEEILKDIIQEIYMRWKTFSQTENKEVCNFCNFNYICNM
jgi:CRISPR/Cas system-associated exonuclease Cas4 (RecB family)